MTRWSRGRSTVRAVARLAGLPAFGLCLGLLAAQLVTQWTPPTYQASASLLISAKADGEVAGQETASITLAQSLAPTIARMAETREVATRAADSLRLPADEVVGQVTGQFEPGMQIVTVAAAARSADRAAGIANEAAAAVIGRLADFALAEQIQVDARVLDRATAPARPVLPKPTLNSALGAIAGLLVGLGLATARNRFDNRLRDVQAVDAQLGLPVLAVFPQLPRRFVPRHVRMLRHGAATVAADALVAGLSVFVDSLPGRRILVTSARHDDGKAMVAALLALRIAGGRDDVTLVEAQTADQGDPQPVADRILLSFMERTFGRQPATGPVPTVVGADLAGQWSTGGQLDETIGRKDDDLVVHAPPVLTGTTAATLARRVDAVVLVVRRGDTDAADARQASMLMRHLGVPFVGVVVVDGAAMLSHRLSGRPDRIAAPGSDGGRHRRPDPPAGAETPAAAATPTATAPRATQSAALTGATQSAIRAE
ncbi:hypothetical protein O7543_15070 [Solwaraspora sp. WMMA2080]|uniref:hypothetical protein n=1 Tax=unclassified Solwaraspora TaxID=2627926 RepID=UPI00248C937F|nr:MULTISPECIES: hypothetical protein [unclassified Solwaraspora]WBB97813.1 hypothetical protein O7553_02275 [Solwaraspora sp. WMMA2059]WBC18297.1 hypothetical protein O7543_15070 [Solwaraspora sp. WMMA2080]